MHIEIGHFNQCLSVQVMNTEFLKIDYYSELQIFWLEWQEGAQDMSEVIFKRHLIEFVELFERHQSIGFVVDSRKGHFTMHEEIQAWHETEIVPSYLKHKLKKIAFIMPVDIFAEVSILQTFQEEKASVLTTNYFNDLDSAFSWIKPYQ
jgi:hypothetical protein